MIELASHSFEPSVGSCIVDLLSDGKILGEECLIAHLRLAEGGDDGSLVEHIGALRDVLHEIEILFDDQDGKAASPG